MADIRRVFSDDYASACAGFRAEAQRAGFELRAYPIGQRGPDGSELTIDVALRGPETASRALVVSCGLHGIEGYFGSAVQRAFLEGPCEKVPRERRLVLVHALNPYGFAWRRRANEDNVDLNRNFMREGQPYAGADPAYREFDAVLNPKRAPRLVEPFLLEALPALARHGFRAMKNAVAQGQYEYPRGLFYGGSSLCRSGQLLREHAPGWLGNPEQVLHIDLHTGRGAYATYALCVDMQSSDPRAGKLRGRFGAPSVEMFDPSGVLYEIRGALGPWLEELFPHARYDCLLAEFGTYHAIKVLEALRYESLAHHYAANDARTLERAKQRLFEAFCPRSPSWRKLVLRRALNVLRQAI